MKNAGRAQTNQLIFKFGRIRCDFASFDSLCAFARNSFGLDFSSRKGAKKILKALREDETASI
jgi:hypothetical protein